MTLNNREREQVWEAVQIVGAELQTRTDKAVEAMDTILSVCGVPDRLIEEPPKELLCVMDTTYPSARDTVESYGELVGGAVVLRVEYSADDACECCSESGTYHIRGIGCYAPLCSEHLAQQPGVTRLVEDETELDNVGVTPGEVSR